VVKDEAQYELDKVMPLLEEARKAVENIDRPGLINLRSYSSPPKIAEIIMEGVLIFLEKKYSWKEALF
jgi:hypothetical protein